MKQVYYTTDENDMFDIGAYVVGGSVLWFAGGLLYAIESAEGGYLSTVGDYVDIPVALFNEEKSLIGVVSEQFERFIFSECVYDFNNKGLEYYVDNNAVYCNDRITAEALGLKYIEGVE